jgi:hypothetical protein
MFVVHHHIRLARSLQSGIHWAGLDGWRTARQLCYTSHLWCQSDHCQHYWTRLYSGKVATIPLGHGSCIIQLSATLSIMHVK